MNLQEFPRIVIVQTAFIGDVTLALYLAQAVKNVHPACHLAFMTTPVAAPLVRCAAAVDEVIVFDKRVSQNGLQGIRSAATLLGGYDCILSAHRSLRTSFVVRLASPRMSVGFNNASGAWLYKQRVEYLSTLHEAERVMNLLSVFDDVPRELFVKAPEPIIRLHPILSPHPPPSPKGRRRQIEALSFWVRENHIKPLVAIAPGSVWATKRWCEDSFARVAQELQGKGYAVVLVGGKDDAALCERISTASGAPSVAGATTLPELMAILRHASVLVGNDSAPVHLANLVGCSVVALFGPTVREFGFAPRGEQDMVIENAELFCRPCSPHGTHECPLGTHECMKSIGAERVVEAVVERMT